MGDSRGQSLPGGELVAPEQEFRDRPTVSCACPVRAVPAGAATTMATPMAAAVTTRVTASGAGPMADPTRGRLRAPSRLPHRHARRPPLPRPTPLW